MQASCSNHVAVHTLRKRATASQNSCADFLPTEALMAAARCWPSARNRPVTTGLSHLGSREPKCSLRYDGYRSSPWRCDTIKFAKSVTSQEKGWW